MNKLFEFAAGIVVFMVVVLAILSAFTRHAPAQPPAGIEAPQAALNQRTYTPSNARVITPGAGALDPRPRELFITVAGNITVVNEDTTTTGSIPVPVGRINLQPYKITAATATVVGFYDR